MILAAGRGERLKPITDQVPKPLVEVGGKPLIAHHLERLADAGFGEIVVNLSHLGEHIEEEIGDGSRFGVRVHYSWEPGGALETGGGIFQALELLGTGPFAVVNGDIYTDYPFSRLRAVKCDSAHLVLVPNPPHNPGGDFALASARIANSGENMGTFSGVAVYHPQFFADAKPGTYSVVPMLRETVERRVVTGEWHFGTWSDVGTPDRLEEIRNQLR